MEEETPSGGLGLWILGPPALMVIIILALPVLPSNDCESSDGLLHGPGPIIFGSVALIAASAVAVAGVLRCVQIYRWGLFREADTWLLAGAVLVASLAAGLVGSNGGSGEVLGGFLIGGFLLAILSFLALLVAFFKGMTADEVGVLVPIYLFGAGMAYVFIAWVVLDLNASGGIC